MEKLWATIGMKINEIGNVAVEDREGLEIHETEHEAKEAVENGLRSGERAVALFVCEGVYEVGEIKLTKLNL